MNRLLGKSDSDSDDPDLARYRAKAARLSGRNRTGSSGHWNPDPGRSNICYECRTAINDIHSFPWADLTKGMAVPGLGTLTARADWRTVKPDSQAYCAMCVMLQRIIDANLGTIMQARPPAAYLYCRLQPSLLGTAFDLDPRRTIGQVAPSTRKRYDRWCLGLEVKAQGSEKDITFLANVLHCAIRPLPSPFYRCAERFPSKIRAALHNRRESLAQSLYTNIDEAPFDMRAILHGRHRPLECDVELIKAWMHLCNKRHGAQCARTASSRAAIRLIDVKDQCLVSSHGVGRNKDYVALSYVWGDKKHSYTSIAQVYSTLSEKDALRKLALPQTVADAMLLVQRLGLRYLWVDFLCIRQDDVEDKHRQISQMGFVYQTALFTIIAASGNDCDAGLPGLRPGTRVREQDRVQAGNITLLSAVQNPCHQIVTPQTSKWARRGWCYQEEFLSARQLIFTDDQIWWKCSCATWCEASQLESEDAVSFLLQEHQVRPRLEERYGFLKPPAYAELVTKYAERELSYASDGLNAFSGILSMLTQYSGEEFLWGHMTSIFEQQLYWFGTASARTFTGQDKLPTWSWVSWQGEISFGHHLTYNPTIQCYVLDTAQIGVKCTRVSSPKTFDTANNPPSITMPPDQTREVHPTTISNDYFQAEPTPGFHLFFYTYTATFYLTPQGRLILPNVPGTFWGKSNNFPRPDYGYIIPTLPGSDLCENGARECILLGHKPARSEYDDPHVVVMLIARDTERVAHRLGIADIPLERWELADKRWELIVLG